MFTYSPPVGYEGVDTAAAGKAGGSLADFLNENVFAGQSGIRIEPDPKDVAGFDTFMTRYTEGLSIERAAVEHLK